MVYTNYETFDVIFFFLVSFAGSMIITRIITNYVTKYNKESMILYILTMLLILAFIMVFCYGASDIIAKGSKSFEISGPCWKSHFLINKLILCLFFKKQEIYFNNFIFKINLTGFLIFNYEFLNNS